MGAVVKHARKEGANLADVSMYTLFRPSAGRLQVYEH